MHVLTDLFSGFVRQYNELEVDPPKLHARKNGLHAHNFIHIHLYFACNRCINNYNHYYWLTSGVAAKREESPLPIVYRSGVTVGSCGTVLVCLNCIPIIIIIIMM